MPFKKFLGIFGLFLALSSARADLQVFPTRLLLTDTHKTAQISLRHIANKPTKYRITTVFYRQSADGSMEPIKQPRAEERSATDLVRYSPREVLLQPNVEQVVRVMAFSSKPLPDGEYRAHLHFEPMPESASEAKAGDVTDKRAAMNLQARIAVAVPVVYRRGKVEVSAALSQLSLIRSPDGKPSFSVDISRRGQGFLYGNLVAFFTPKNGAKTEVGRVLGISSYIDQRKARYPLAPPAGLKLEHGTLRLEYQESADEGAKVLAFAETTLP